MYNLKEINIKNCICYHLDDKIKIEEVNFGNISLDEKPYDGISFVKFHTKFWLPQNHCVLSLMK